MAENQAARLTPVPIARAELNITNRGVAVGPAQFDRSDMTLHHALPDPPAPVEPKPVPPQPSEADLRQQLAEAITEHKLRKLTLLEAMG